jgi:phage shock protein E
MKKAIVFLALALASLTVFAKNVLIDVRTDQEYAAGHIDGAVNIDHSKIAQDIAKADAGKDDTVILYCQSGRRSALAQETLKKMGFSHVENYGGIEQARKLLQKP